MPQPLTKRMNEAKPVHWVPREREQKKLSALVDADFYDKVQEHCQDSGLKVAQFVRYACALEMRRA